MTAPPQIASPLRYPTGLSGRASRLPSVTDREATSRQQANKRIVHVSLGTEVGGMEKLLVEFARFANRSRFHLSFVSLQQRGRLADEIEQLGWPVIALDKPTGLKPGIVLRLARMFRQWRPDVVHTHNTAAFLYGVSAAAIARVPRIVHTRHGQRFAAPKRQTRLFRWLSRWVDCVVSVSEDGRQLTIAEGIDPQRTGTIRNGIDISRFPRVGPKLGGRAVLVARLSPEKDVATLIRAVDIVNRSIKPNDVQFGLDIVGDGSDRAALESLARQLGIDKLIQFHGLRSDIPTVLSRASMFVLPSLTEGISLTLLEAMAMGLPVVATRVGGNPEVVDEFVSGLLVPPRGPQEMADAMLRFHRDPALSQEYGRAGRSRVEQQFSVQRMLEQYEELYVGEARP